MKNKKLFEAILILLSIIVIYILVRNNYKEIAHSIIHANIGWIIIAILLYIMYLVLQAIPFYQFARLYDKNIKFSFFIYLIIVTNFFNGITPLATGGQPLQVYEIHKKKISVVDSTNIVIQNSVIFQVSIVLWLIFAFIINNTYHLFPVSRALKNLAGVGLILNLAFLGALISVSFSKKFNKKLINWIISILSKLKIVKNPDKQKEKWDKTCNDFYENSQILLKNKKLLFYGIIFVFLAFSFYFAVPYAIAHALHIGNNISLITSLFITCYVFLSSSYLPIPGATGGTEYSFLGYFKTFITGYKLNAFLIIWRFLTYYLPTIVGGIIFNINSLKNSN